MYALHFILYLDIYAVHLVEFIKSMAIQNTHNQQIKLEWYCSSHTLNSQHIQKINRNVLESKWSVFFYFCLYVNMIWTVFCSFSYSIHRFSEPSMNKCQYIDEKNKEESKHVLLTTNDTTVDKFLTKCLTQAIVLIVMKVYFSFSLCFSCLSFFLGKAIKRV